MRHNMYSMRQAWGSPKKDRTPVKHWLPMEYGFRTNLPWCRKPQLSRESRSHLRALFICIEGTRTRWPCPDSQNLPYTYLPSYRLIARPWASHHKTTHTIGCLRGTAVCMLHMQTPISSHSSPASRRCRCGMKAIGKRKSAVFP